jgi:PhzF family phenazine biosynthesis protein
VKLPFRVVNVFGLEGVPFSGNPLCVFADADGLPERTMQALARQTNLSETTFALAPERADTDVRVRIFTPSYEMPFAGHPSLGTAFVVGRGRARIVLGTNAGPVPVTMRGPFCELRAAKAPTSRSVGQSRREAEISLGLAEGALLEAPMWIDTGAPQIVARVDGADTLAAARPSFDGLVRLAGQDSPDEAMVYLVAEHGDGTCSARFFFTQLGGVVEDPATGSACANLGGYLTTVLGRTDVALRVHQGGAVDRPSELFLRVDPQGIFVGGRVAEIMDGVVSLDPRDGVAGGSAG